LESERDLFEDINPSQKEPGVVIHLGRNTWRELEKRVIRSLKVVYRRKIKGPLFIHSEFILKKDYTVYTVPSTTW
jgi:hypothetical protein